MHPVAEATLACNQESRNEGLIACLDVHYRGSAAFGACVLIEDWASSEPAAELTERFMGISSYVAGKFFRRELPCIASLARKANDLYNLKTVVVDGFVWLGSRLEPGLGAHLYDDLGCEIPVVGVAKNWLPGAFPSRRIFRGDSKRPLFISAVGLALGDACAYILSMHGKYRIPTILKRTDQLSRELGMT